MWEHDSYEQVRNHEDYCRILHSFTKLLIVPEELHLISKDLRSSPHVRTCMWICLFLKSVPRSKCVVILLCAHMACSQVVLLCSHDSSSMFLLFLIICLRAVGLSKGILTGLE